MWEGENKEETGLVVGRYLLTAHVSLEFCCFMQAVSGHIDIPCSFLHVEQKPWHGPCWIVTSQCCPPEAPECLKRKRGHAVHVRVVSRVLSCVTSRRHVLTALVLPACRWGKVVVVVHYVCGSDTSTS